MEEEVKADKKRTRFSAYEIFKPMNQLEFYHKVMPFVKAYYKHNHPNDLALHEMDYDEGVCAIWINVGRQDATLYFHYDIEDEDKHSTARLENEHNDLKAKDMYNFLSYEYFQLFDKSNVYSWGYDENQEKTDKKQRIIL